MKHALSVDTGIIKFTLDLKEQAMMSAQRGIEALISKGMSPDQARDTYWDWVNSTGIFKSD